MNWALGQSFICSCLAISGDRYIVRMMQTKVPHGAWMLQWKVVWTGLTHWTDSPLDKDKAKQSSKGFIA